MYKVISFDAGNTLIKQKNSKKILTISKAFHVNENQLREIFKNTICIFPLEKAKQELLHYFNEQQIEFIKTVYAKQHKVKVFKGVYKTLKTLKAKNYKIIISSNSTCFNVNTLPKELLALVDKLYVSYEIGYAKPDGKFFSYILNDLNLQKNEIIHIGDSMKSDYLAAHSFGIDAALITNVKNAGKKHITNVNEIWEIL